MPTPSKKLSARRKPTQKQQRALMRSISTLRKRLGLSMYAVADESGYYSQSMLSLLELGSASMSRRGYESLTRWVASKRRKPATQAAA